MIKIKVFQTNVGWKSISNTTFSIADYCYCVYLFGYLIHSVTICGINLKTANMMFKGIKIESTYEG